MSIEIDKVVKKLVGPVEPVGETHEDAFRFENLKTLAAVTDDLLNILYRVSQKKDRHEHSVSRSGKYAAKFLDGVKKEIDEWI